jgi:hypothetical protein
VVTLYEEAASLVRNAKGSLDVAKGRALAYIAVKAADLLPVVEATNAQEEDCDKRKRVQRAIQEIARRDPRVTDLISDQIELYCAAEKLAESYKNGEFELPANFTWKRPESSSWVCEYSEGTTDDSDDSSENESFSPRKNEN